MATFRGIVKGSRGSVTRLGHKHLTTHCDGWEAGITVHASKHEDGSLYFEVWQTGGSNGGDLRLLGTLEESTSRWITPEKKAT